MSGYTPAAAVAAIFAVVPLLLSLSCAGEAIFSAQASLKVGQVQLAVNRCGIGVGVGYSATGEIKGNNTIVNNVKAISTLRNIRNL